MSLAQLRERDIFGNPRRQRRHRKVLKDNEYGITKTVIRRLARRGGVVRISDPIYEETRRVLKIFLRTVLRDAVTYLEHMSTKKCINHHIYGRERKTLTAIDVMHALKRQGCTLYGFGG